MGEGSLESGSTFAPFDLLLLHIVTALHWTLPGGNTIKRHEWIHVHQGSESTSQTDGGTPWSKLHKPARPAERCREQHLTTPHCFKKSQQTHVLVLHFTILFIASIFHLSYGTLSSNSRRADIVPQRRPHRPGLPWCHQLGCAQQ